MRAPRLSRSPAPAVFAMLAASMAVTTLAMSVAWAALYRPPPFAESDRIAVLYTVHAQRDGGSAEWRWSYPRLTMLQQTARSFERVAPFAPVELTLVGSDETEAVQGELAGAGYFELLETGPALGRLYTSAEDDPATGLPVAVISHDLWQRRFGGASSAVGATLRVNGIPHEIVGVMPARFRGLSDRAQLWLPMSSAPRVEYAGYLTTDQDFIEVAARLAPGVTMARATAELRSLVPRLYEAYPDTDHDVSDRPAGVARALGEARRPAGARAALMILLGASALLHLLAAANVATLLLGHAIRRRREFGVRLALGAEGGRLARWQLREHAVVPFVGGVAGIAAASVVARGFSESIARWLPQGRGGAVAAFADADVSWEVASVAVALAALTAVAVALVPAMVAARAPTAALGRDGGRSASARGTALGRWSPRSALLACEMALALALCVVGALMFESFDRMRHTDIGVEASRVLTFEVSPDDVRVPPSRAAPYVARMLAAIEGVPGVESASVDGGAPVSGTARTTVHGTSLAPAAGEAEPVVLRHYVAPTHFRTLGIPILRGRLLDARDVAGRQPVAVISASAARRLWPGEDPIGRRAWFGGSAFTTPDSAVEIVGVVADVVYDPVDRAPNRASFYTPYAQFTYGARTYFVRTSGDPTAIVPAIRRAVRAVDPATPVTDVRTLEEVIGASWSRHRSNATFYLAFAALALALAASGIFAVVAHAVGERGREMAIRLALGARAGDVVLLVVREGLTFPLLGAMVGLALTFALGGVLRSSLYGVAPNDPATLAIAAGVLLLAAIAATLVPAWRATQVDPQVTLRSE